MKKQDKYPKGHFVNMWMAIGIAIFSGIGVPLSIATDNPGFIGIGPALGVSIGLAIGSGIEEKYKREGKIRPLTKEEEGKRKTLVTIGLLILIVGALLGFVLLLFLSHF
jgi:hypothetical protein